MLGKIVSGVDGADDDEAGCHPGVMPGLAAIAFRAACAPRSDVATPGSTMWRSRMPVRCKNPFVGRFNQVFEVGVASAARGGRRWLATHRRAAARPCAVPGACHQQS